MCGVSGNVYFWFRNMMSEVGSEEWDITVVDIFGRLDTLRI